MTAQTPAELLAEPVGDRIQVSERLWGFVWGPDATHLASAQELRVVRPI